MELASLPVEETCAAGYDVDSAAVLDALDCLRVAVTLYDSDERLTYLNSHFRYIFRAMPHESALIGLSYADQIRLEIDSGEIAQPEPATGTDTYIAERRAQLTAGDFAPRDIHLADGRIIETKARRTPDGGWIVLWSDVTQARHDHGRLQNAIELSADAFAFWDKDDRLVLCNPGFAKLHGQPPNKCLKGVAFATLMAEVAERGLVRLDGTLEAWIGQRLDAHNAPAGALTIVTADGNAYLVRERATRDGGRATVYTDVTERHRAETAFSEASAALRATRRALDSNDSYLADLTKRLDKAEESAAKTKTTFLRTMSHELKTPLNAIIGFSDLLKTSYARIKPDQVGEYAGLIHTAGGNLLSMLNRILDLTKIAAERYPLNSAPIEVRNILDGACDAFREKAEDKGLTITVDPCPADLAVYGDESALTTMIGQLAENAVAFAPEGGEVRLRAESAGGRVRIRVADNGPGVPAEDIERILEPFEQVNSGTADHSGGGGLGLPLVKALAELQGGTLTLESTPGQGFAATFDLPAG